jgi:hypothetical protein
LDSPQVCVRHAAALLNQPLMGRSSSGSSLW